MAVRAASDLGLAHPVPAGDLLPVNVPKFVALWYVLRLTSVPLEMVDIMKFLASLKTELTAEERSLLSVAYKNVVGARRAAWRIVTSVEAREAAKGNSTHIALLLAYRRKIERELTDICADLIAVLDANLIRAGTAADSLVFYHKMKGDYLRYLAEVATGQERTETAKNSLAAYQHAYDLAVVNLLPTDPVRLSVVLNFGVFYHEILSMPSRACDLMRQAVTDAINGLDDLTEENYKDTTLILNLLQDAARLWTETPENDS